MLTEDDNNFERYRRYATKLEVECRVLKAKVAELEGAAESMNVRLREIYYEVAECSPTLAKGNESPELTEWLRAEALKHRDREAELDAQLKAEKKAHLELHAAACETEEEMGRLEADLKVEIADSRSRSLESSARIEGLTGDFDRSEAKVAQLESKLRSVADMSKQCFEAEDKVAALEKDCDTLQGMEIDLQERNSTMRSAISELERRLEGALRASGGYSKACDGFADKVAALEAENTQLKKELRNRACIADKLSALACPPTTDTAKTFPALTLSNLSDGNARQSEKVDLGEYAPTDRVHRVIHTEGVELTGERYTVIIAPIDTDTAKESD